MSGRRFLVYWMITFLGFPLGGVLALLTVGSIQGPAEGAVGGALAGVGIGTAQWLALRGRLAVGPLWIFASALGLGLGDAAGAVMLWLARRQTRQMAGTRSRLSGGDPR